MGKRGEGMQGTFNTREHGQEGGGACKEHSTHESMGGAIDKTRGTAEAGMAAILGTNPNMYT